MALARRADLSSYLYDERIDPESTALEIFLQVGT
jgi:hypothetical protein